MKIILLLSSILVMSLLQGCAGFGSMFSPAEETSLNKSVELSAEKAAPVLAIKQPVLVPEQHMNEDMPRVLNEARIIKELSDAGCTIASFEMNKHKQNIRIICADSVKQSDFSI